MNLQIQAVLHARVGKIACCRIVGMVHINRLLTRPSTCYGEQYERHVVSPLIQNKRVLSGLILLLFILSQGLAPYDQLTFAILTKSVSMNKRVNMETSTILVDMLIDN